MGKTEKVSVAMLLLLLFTLPLAVIVVLRPVLFEPRAAMPPTPLRPRVDGFSVSNYCDPDNFRNIAFECLDSHNEYGERTSGESGCKAVDDWYEVCMESPYPVQEATEPIRTGLPRPTDFRSLSSCPPIPEGCEEVAVKCPEDEFVCCPAIVCPGSPMPTSTATLPPLSEYNQAPVITTENLNSAVVGSSYRMSIDGYDDDSDDVLTMVIDGLPSGVGKNFCTTRRAVSGRNWLMCTIEGSPQKAGIYRVDVTMFDGRGGTDQKHLSLEIRDVPRTFHERIFYWVEEFRKDWSFYGQN